MVKKRFRKRERALNTIKSGFQKLEPVVNKAKVIMPLFPLGVVDPRSMLFGLIIIKIVGPLHAQRLIK